MLNRAPMRALPENSTRGVRALAMLGFALMRRDGGGSGVRLAAPAPACTSNQCAGLLNAEQSSVQSPAGKQSLRESDHDLNQLSRWVYAGRCCPSIPLWARLAVVTTHAHTLLAARQSDGIPCTRAKCSGKDNRPRRLFACFCSPMHSPAPLPIMGGGGGGGGRCARNGVDCVLHGEYRCFASLEHFSTIGRCINYCGASVSRCC